MAPRSTDMKNMTNKSYDIVARDALSGRMMDRAEARTMQEAMSKAGAMYRRWTSITVEIRAIDISTIN